MAIRMQRTVRNQNGVYEAASIFTGLSPVQEAALVQGGDAIYYPATDTPGFVTLAPQAATLVSFGDSIARIFESSGGVDYKADSHIVMANALAGWPFQLAAVANSGETSTQIKDRLAAEVLPLRPAVVVCSAGTNDPGQSIAASTTIANIKVISDALAAIGCDFVFGLIMPQSTEAAVNSAANARRTHRNLVNAWARNYARSSSARTNRGRFYVADFEGAVTDPATGLARTNYLMDGVHQAYIGSFAMGQELAPILVRLAPQADPLAASFFDPYNLAGAPTSQGVGNNASGTNGFAIAASSGTGTGPSGWYTWRRGAGGSAVFSGAVTRAADAPRATLYGRAVVTATAAYDGAGFQIGANNGSGPGRWDSGWVANTPYTHPQKVRAVAGDNGYRYVVVVPGTSHATTEPTWPTTEGECVTDGTVTWMCIRRPRLGEQVYGEVDVVLSSLTGNAGVTCDLNFTDTTGAGVQRICPYMALDNSQGSPPAVLQSGVVRLRTPLLTIPSDSIRYLYLRVGAYGAASSSVTVDVSRVVIRNYTQMLAL